MNTVNVQDIYGDLGLTSSLRGIFVLTVAIVYSILASNIGDKLGNWEAIDKMCDDVKPGKCTSFSCEDSFGQLDDCRKRRRELEKEFDQNKLNYVLIVGSLSLLAGALVSSGQFNEYNLQTSGVGVSLGSLFMLIYFITKNWYALNNNARITILGISFAVLVYGSSKILKF